MEEIWLDALHQYIKSHEWLGSLRAWVDANCAAFDDDSEVAALGRGAAGACVEASVGQFALFVDFRALAERCLGKLLDDLGCAGPAAEDALLGESSRWCGA